MDKNHNTDEPENIWDANDSRIQSIKNYNCHEVTIDALAMQNELSFSSPPEL